MDAQQPMSSREKVIAALAKLDEIDMEDAPAQMKALVFLFTLQRDNIVAMLPADPGALDELLLTGAWWALKLRGDDAESFVLEPIETPA